LLNVQWEIFQTYSEREQDKPDHKTKHEGKIWQPVEESSTSAGKVWRLRLTLVVMWVEFWKQSSNPYIWKFYICWIFLLVVYQVILYYITEFYIGWYQVRKV